MLSCCDGEERRKKNKRLREQEGGRRRQAGRQAKKYGTEWEGVSGKCDEREEGSVLTLLRKDPCWLIPPTVLFCTSA